MKVLLYFQYFIFLRAAGGVEGKLVPFLFAQERRAERRMIGHFARHNVRLFRTDDRVYMLLIRAYLLHGHGRAHADDARLGAADDFCVLKYALKIANAFLYRGQHLARLLILGVLGQVA